MKKEDWGLLTVAALLSSFLFPPYFLSILAISGLTSLAMALRPSEGQPGIRTLIDFELEFRVGHEHEEHEAWPEALEVYRRLAEKYAAEPALRGIALQRIQFVEDRHVEPVG